MLYHPLQKAEMKYFIFLLLCFKSGASFSQNLGTQRVNHVKNSIVKISIDGNPVGTGFIISDKGQVLTCFHVIVSALSKNSQNQIFEQHTIEAEFISGEKVQIHLDSATDIEHSFFYDYCLLKPVSKPVFKYEYLKLGNFKNINEGDAVFTIGYPLGIQQPFISKGTLSTKFVDSTQLSAPNTKIKREAAWIDLTLNKGNSGGPIIKIGSTTEQDQVIGIATFILNPLNQKADSLLNQIYQYKNSGIEMHNTIGGVDFQLASELVTLNAVYFSVGISGCISIEHFKKKFKF